MSWEAEKLSSFLKISKIPPQKTSGDNRIRIRLNIIGAEMRYDANNKKGATK